MKTGCFAAKTDLLNTYREKDDVTGKKKGTENQIDREN